MMCSFSSLSLLIIISKLFKINCKIVCAIISAAIHCYTHILIATVCNLKCDSSRSLLHYLLYSCFPIIYKKD